MSWLLHITWCPFTTCLSSRGKLTTLLACPKTVSMTYCLSAEDKIWSGQILSVFFKNIFDVISFPLEDKHMNEHYATRKSHYATQEKCPHMVYFHIPCDWFETNSQHQKRYSERSKKICGCHGLLVLLWLTLYIQE